MSLPAIQQQIQHELNSIPGTFALAFINPDNPKQQLLINAKEVFHAASTMKTPVMIEVYRQSSQGKFSLQDSILVKNEFKSIVDGSLYSMNIKDDSGEGLYKMIGKTMTIEALVYDMITYSSNLATNILIDKVGAKNVMITMKALGANDIQVLRGVEDSKAYQQGLNNTTTAYDLMLIFQKMALHQLVNAEVDQAMINVLLEQKFNEIIPAALPKSVKVAHKTGSITGVQHDTGIVYLPDGRKYVLVLLSKNLQDSKQGIAILSKVSGIIYRYMIQK
ncbi:serine hydrolase [Rhodocytophaga rosea]|nr:serine hydrolase [Rhodocytophaga rosea]